MALRFSIVIPNFNSGPVLERAIVSLLNQDYPNLQLIVCDSESTDESRHIIEKYRDRFDTVIIKKDKGQPDGLNNGFAHANGDLFGWLCADDELLPGALKDAAAVFEADPGVDVVTGVCERVYADGQRALSPPPADPWRVITTQCCLEQSATFWRASLARRVGPLDTSYFLLFDWDLWNRFHTAGARIVTSQTLYSRYYFSETNKTGSAGKRFTEEGFRVLRKYGPRGGLIAYVFRFLYNHFDLKGCYDKPPTCTLARSHAFMWALAGLRVVIGQELLYRYNWHFASCQQRGLKWW